MQKLILIKYAELNTKKDNIGLFLKTLKNNIINSLNNLEVTINYDKGRMYVIPKDEDFSFVLDKIKNVFGISSIAIGYEYDNKEIDVLGENIVNLIKDREFKTFKVETKRSDKSYPLTSLEVSQKLGSIILKNYSNLKVDVKNPEVVINVEIRKNNSYFYFDEVKGLGGYPVGTLGKGLLLLSGGLDSPVSGYLAMKRGVKIEAIYFDSPPHTSIEAKNKVIELANILSKYEGNLKLHIIPFTKLQEEIYKNVRQDYVITIMRRMMYRISERVSIKNKCKILVNGESIGQVASQTLESMNVINNVVKIPVIRPVACFDKLEIIALAKKIKTYDTSILPYQDCCTIFVPEHPVIYPDLEICEEEETKFDYESLIKEAIKNSEIINTKEKKNEFTSYL